MGKPVQAVVLFIAPPSGDRIEFLAAEPIGVAVGASVRFYASHAVLHADGSMVIGEKLEPLAGAIAEADAGASPGYMDTVGIVAEITPHQSGRFVMTSVRLRYRLSGGKEQTGEGIDVALTVCADVPAPADCPE